MLDEIVVLADHIVNESEDGIKCVGVEAVSLRTGEVCFDFFGDYALQFVDNKLIHEKCDPVQAAFERYPLSEYSVTFHGVVWARQKKLQYMIEELDKLEERAAYWQDKAEKSDEERDKLHADFAFGNAYNYAKECVEIYHRFTDYSIKESTALRAVAKRTIDYSLIKS